MTENKVILVGRLGKDPDVRYAASGIALATFSVATNSRKKGASGEYEDNVQWHNCLAFKKTAEIVGEYLRKGDQVYISGAIDYQTWEKDGVKHYRTQILVDKVIMIGVSGIKKNEATPEEHQEAVDGAVDGTPVDDSLLPF